MTATPHDIENYFRQALAAHQRGQLSEAATLYRRVLEHNQQHVDALHLLGTLAHQRGNQQSALTLIRQALLLRPGDPAIHYNLACVLQAAGQLTEAAQHFEATVQRQPQHIDAWVNLAVVLQDGGALDAARDANHRALALKPDHALALRNLGTLCHQRGERAEARRLFELVLVQHPMLAEVRVKLAQLDLLEGRLSAGWAGDAWSRFNPDFLRANPARLVPFATWCGQHLPPGSLLLQADLGIGDVVMFASLLPEVLAHTDSPLLECDARLILLLQRSFPTLRFLAKQPGTALGWHRQLGPLSHTAQLSRLAALFRAQPGDFPVHAGYLRADPLRVQAWRSRLNERGNHLNIGIAWRGGIDPRAQLARSIPLAAWRELANTPGVQLVDLQYGDQRAEIAAFNAEGAPALLHFDDLDLHNDLDGSAALIRALDLVISIDNSTVHLAGALGVPTWVLLPFTPDWRWLLDRSSSPWYPALRLFRASAPGAAALQATLADAIAALRSAGTTTSTARWLPPVATQTVATALLSATTTDPYALLLNDTTAWYHYGCACTSLAIHARLRSRFGAVRSIPINETHALAPLPNSIDAFDDPAVHAAFAAQHGALLETIANAAVVVVNGEGTLHGVSQSSLGLLYLMWLAKTRLGRRVCVINHSCYPDTAASSEETPARALYRKVYQRLDVVAVREPASLRAVQSLGIEAVQTFDSLPLFVAEQYQPLDRRTLGVDDQDNYLVLAGSVAWSQAWAAEIGQFVAQVQQRGLAVVVLLGANAALAADDSAFVQSIAARLGPRCRVQLASSEAQWLGIIEQAAALVSGRFHHTIAAASLGTPFLVMDSNTPKIHGLLELLEVDAFVDGAAPALCERLLVALQRLLEAPERYRVSASVRQQLRTLAERNYTSL